MLWAPFFIVIPPLTLSFLLHCLPNLLQFGAFMQSVDLFDASAFGLAGSEVIAMDPQHRLVLELSGEAMVAAAGEHTGKLSEYLL